MGGQHYDRRSWDAERRERGADRQAAQDYLRFRMDKLALTEGERRELVRYALDNDIPIHDLLGELERLLAENAPQEEDDHR